MESSALTEELEVIRSIYDGDSAMLLLTEEKLQYKFGEDNHYRSFVVEISWPPGYPESADAQVNLELFYNKRLSSAVKRHICESIAAQMDSWKGSAMTYAILEYIKDSLEELTAGQLEMEKMSVEDSGDADQSDAKDETDRDDAVHNRQQLSKAQKRKMWDKSTAGATDRERGWNWIDIIKHLSQTADSL